MATVGSGWQYYVTLLLVYLGVDIIACLGLNIQLGLAGVMDFAFIIFQAAGAYVYAIFTLGGVIAIEGALAFLGLSVPSPTASWGNLISDASNDPQAPWVFILSPAIALCFTLVSLYWVAEKIRQRFDPGEQKL